MAGIRPAPEMTDATSFNEVRPTGARAHLEFPLTADRLVAAFRAAVNWNKPFADRPGDTALSGAAGVAGARGARGPAPPPPHSPPPLRHPLSAPPPPRT